MSEVCASVKVVFETKEVTELINCLNKSLELIQGMAPFGVSGIEDSEIGDVFGKATIKIVETVAILCTASVAIRCEDEDDFDLTIQERQNIGKAYSIAADNAGLSCPLSSDACGELLAEIRDLLTKQPRGN